MTREELKENICGMTYDDMFEYIYELENKIKGNKMKTINKIDLIKQALETNDVQSITTDRFDGVWFNVDGNEVIALTNEELTYASNNIVDGDIMEVMPEHELFDNINIFYPY